MFRVLRTAVTTTPLGATRRLVVLGGLFATLMALHWTLSRGMPGPTIVDNELGYIANARVLAGGTAPLHPWFTPTNYMGYSLLLVPLYWAGLEPGAVYQGALVINALLGASVGVLGYALARTLFALSPRNALIAAVVTGLYPAVLMNSSLSWAENLLFPLALLTVLLAYRLLAAPTPLSAVVFGGLNGFLYMAHPRLLPSVGLALVFLGAAAVRRLLPVPLMLIAVGALATIGLVTRLAHNELLPRIYGEGGTAFADNQIGAYLDVLSSTRAMWVAFLSGTGTVWYLALASCGLVIVGAIHLGRVSAGMATDRRVVSRWVAGFALSLMIGAILVSGMSINDDAGRIDYRFYGRYAEAYGPLLTLSGVAGILSAATTRARIAFWATGAGLGAVAWAIMLFGFGRDRFEPPEFTAGAAVLSAITPGWLAFPSDPGYRIDLAFCVLVATALVAIVASAWSVRVALVIVMGLFGASAAIALHRYVEPQSAAINGAATLQESSSLRGVRAISYDRSGEQMFVMPLYQFHLPEAQFALFDSRVGQVPTSPFVIATSGWSAADTLGARAVAEESSVDQVLWVLPGMEADALERAGRLLPDPLNAVLPQAAMDSALSLNSPHIAMCAGETHALTGTLKHTGAGNAWRQVAYASTRQPGGWVYIVAQWRSEVDRAITEERAAGNLPRTLSPGEGARVDVEVSATTDDGRPLTAGSYVLRLSPHQDGVGSFWSAGRDDPHDIPVEVRSCT